MSAGNVLDPPGYGRASASQIFQGAQPAAGPSLPSSGGMDAAIQSILGGGAGPGITNEDIVKALTPIAQPAPLQMPASLTREIRDPGPAPQDRSRVVGAGNARAQGIGNTISASIGALAQFKASRDRQKQEAQGQQVSRFIQAQDGITQAQQILASDPKNTAAQQALKQNQDLIQGMFQDPKFVKTIEKGFNVSLTDPSQNKTPEHGIVQRGIDLFKKGKQQEATTPAQASAMASRFSAQQPTMLAPNQQAIQALQMKQSLAKDQNALLRSILPAAIRADAEMKKTDYTQQQANWRAQLKDQATHDTIAGANARAYVAHVDKWDLAHFNAQERQNLAYVNFGYHMKIADHVLANKDSDPNALLKGKFEADQKMQHSELVQKKYVDSLSNDLLTYKNPPRTPQGAFQWKVDPAVVKQKEDTLKKEQDGLVDMQAAHKDTMTQFDERITGYKVGGANAGPGAGGTATPGATGRPDLSGSGSAGTAGKIANAKSPTEIYSALGLTDTEDEDADEGDTGDN